MLIESNDAPAPKMIIRRDSVIGAPVSGWGGAWDCALYAALREREQVVAPCAVRISSNVGTAGPVPNPNVRPTPADECVKGVRSVVDRIDHLLTSPPPVGSPEMGDALVGIFPRLLVDTGHLNVRHISLPLSVSGGNSALLDTGSDPN